LKYPSKKIILNTPGRFSKGTAAAMIVKTPFCIPDDPMPAIALPIISIFEDVATPHSNEPNSKIAKKTMNIH
jgi:hypothetical protein